MWRGPRGSIYAGYFQTGKIGTPHVYKVEGIGEDMLCAAMDFKVLDQVRQVDDRQSFVAARRLAREEASSAAAARARRFTSRSRLAKEGRKSKTIVVILPDGGSSYISKFYSDEWNARQRLLEEKGRSPSPSCSRGRRAR